MHWRSRLSTLIVLIVLLGIETQALFHTNIVRQVLIVLLGIETHLCIPLSPAPTTVLIVLLGIETARCEALKEKNVVLIVLLGIETSPPVSFPRKLTLS